MIWVCNALIELGWIGATVYLITIDHTYWAIATFIAALISGYSVKRTKTE